MNININQEIKKKINSELDKSNASKKPDFATVCDVIGSIYKHLDE
jgi:hypothetical protein